MRFWLSSVVRPAIAAALLGATLGGLGVVGLFFWQNREMCPCAPVGISDTASVAVPLTPEITQSITVAAGLGALFGVMAAVIWIIPPALRLRRIVTGADLR